MSNVTDNLAAAGYDLPAPSGALGAYVPAVRSGSLVFTSGQLPMLGGRLMTSGLVGGPVDPALAARCASQAALNALAAASSACELDDVERVVRVTVFVASEPGFTGQPTVADGASAVMLAAFGDAGRHARAAVGVSALPLGAPVEVEITLQVR